MNPIYWLGWSCFRLMYATYFRWRVFHPERVPTEGAVLIASNHASFLDPPLIGCGLKRQCAFLARVAVPFSFHALAAHALAGRAH
jgi:1-acyl-sn-glycerol-3-phosphate acyltransferase